MRERIAVRILAFIAGAGLLWNIWVNVLLNFQVLNWPQIAGSIVESSVKRNVWFYENVIGFEYNINGQTYRSYRLRADSAKHYELSYSNAETISKNYHVNKKVVVFIDPKSNKIATLNLYFGYKPLEEWFGFFYACFAVFLLVFAVYGSFRGASGTNVAINIIGRDLESR